MAMNGDDPTRPHSPPTILRLTRVEQAQRDTRTQVESLDQAVTLLTASLQETEGRLRAKVEIVRASQRETEERLGAKIDLMRGDMRKMGERFGEIVDELKRDHRKAEDSHHDLEDAARSAVVIAKTSAFTKPAAVVIAAVLGVYGLLVALGKPVPVWMVGIPGIVGTVLASMFPSLFPGLFDRKKEHK